MLTVEEMTTEFIKCSQDVVYFLSNYIKIPVAGSGEYINLTPWKPQMKYINALKRIWTIHDKNGVLLMASRQCGKTQLTEGIIIWLMLFHPNYMVLHLNRDLGQGKVVIKELRDMIDLLPDWLRPELPMDNKQEGFLFSNGSLFKLQASNSTSDKKSSKGRGLRPTFVWVDEAAFMNLDEHMAAILPAVSRTFLTAKQNGIPYGIVFSSTPNGRVGKGKAFFDNWMRASLDVKDTYEAVSIYWHEIPGYDEKWFEDMCAVEGCTPDKPNSKVNQEYNLQFISSEDSIFGDDVMKSLQDIRQATLPITEEAYVDGYIKWWEMPKNDMRYVVGIDTATADGIDYSAVYVKSFDTGMQVAEGHFKCAVTMFAGHYIPKIIDVLPKKVLVIEKNGCGNQTVEMLSERYEYCILKDTKQKKETPPLGLQSNTTTRKLLLEQIYNLFNDDKRRSTVRSHNLRLEATSLERKASGRIEGNPNDDLCFAAGWAEYAENYYNLFPYFDGAFDASSDDWDDIDLTGDRTMVPDNINTDMLPIFFSDEQIRQVEKLHKINSLRGKRKKDEMADLLEEIN